MIYPQDIKATTEDGRDVLLKQDGTWIFNEKILDENINKDSEYTPKSATSKIDNKTKKVSVFYDPLIWNVEQLKDEDAEYQFKIKTGDVYARLITERISLSVDAIRNAIINNLKKKSENMEIVSEGEKKVNDVNIKTLLVNTRLQGNNFVFYWYYWTGNKGTVQFFSYTTPDIFEEDKNEIFDLMNGLKL